MKDTRQRYARLLVGFGFTALFLYLLAQHLEPQKIGSTLRGISPAYLLVALAFLAADYLIRIVRWWWLLRAIEPGTSFRPCVRPFLVSIALNNLLPFRAGDAARVVGFRTSLGLSPMRVLGSLVIERVLDLIVLLVFFCVGLSGAHSAVPIPLAHAAWWIGALAIGGVLAAAICATALQRLLYESVRAGWLRGRLWGTRVADQVGQVLGALGSFKRPGLLCQLLVLSGLAWGFEGAVFKTVAIAMGLTANAGPWFALSSATFGTLLPSSPGYVGSFDYLAALGLTVYGVNPHSAAVFALTVHLVLWLPLTLTGLLVLLLQNTGPIRSATPNLRSTLAGLE